MSIFSSIPTELFSELKPFLIPIDYYQLIIANKKFFGNVKYATWNISLRSWQIKKYLEEPDFRQLVLSKIQNPNMQLSLLIESSFTFATAELLSIPCRLLLLSQHHWHEIPNWIDYIQDKETFSSTDSKITEFNKFPTSSRLKSMILSDFSALKNVQTLSFLTELSLFNCCHVSEVNCLKDLKFLYIYGSPKITNIQELGKIHHLHIEKCDRITDVSKLNYNHRLLLANCKNISKRTLSFKHVFSLRTDLISCFEESQCLENTCILEFLPGSRYRDSEIHLSSKVRKFTFTGYPPLNLWNFTQLYWVKLVCIHRESMIAPLFAIPIVHIENVTFQALEGLGGNQRVVISQCPYISDFSCLRNVPRVEIRLCNRFSKGSEVENCKELIVVGCRAFEDTSALSRLQSLLLQSCNVSELKAIESIPEISVIGCPLINLKGIGRNHRKIVMDAEYEALFLRNAKK
jgi:hypothetical protein